MRLKLLYSPDEITNNLYTFGKEWMTTDNTEYIGLYHTYTTGEVFTEPTWNIKKSKQLIAYEDTTTTKYQYAQLKSINTSFISPTQYQAENSITQPNQSQLQRYFIQQKNDLTNIIEINSTQYEQYGDLNQERPDDYDPDEVVKIRKNESKSAGYQIVKKYDGSATLILTDGAKVQKVPVSQSELNTYFPEYSRKNIVSDIKSAVIASPNMTTNLAGTMDPVNARMTGFSLPGLSGSGLEEKTRYDVIGSPFNNGSDNDKFQVVMYFNSSKGWVTKVVNESEYVTEQGVSNIINSISPYTINTMLK
jgi:L-cysteine desulfidase